MLYKIAAIYHFVVINDIDNMLMYLEEICNNNKILGALIVANEGINGTISGKVDDLTLMLNELSKNDIFHNENIEIKYSYSEKCPFHRIRIHRKDEIIKMGQPDVKPSEIRGEYVDAAEWNKLISDPNVILIDTRNDYEVDIGTFKNAINPNTKSFTDFPKYVEDNLNPAIHKKVAMYCTGGVRYFFF